MKLISTESLNRWVDNWLAKNKYYHPHSNSNSIPISELKDILELMPAVEAEPVRHGRWEDCTNHESVDFEDKCSVCGYTMFADFSHRFRYCPNCGAKMEEENNDAGA